MKLVSIIIRSRNDAPFIGRVLDAVFTQSVTDIEVLNFDNASTDGTTKIVATYDKVRRFTIPEGEYVPGRVLNQAVSESHGDVVVFNNSDSIPQNRYWLEKLVAPIHSGAACVTYAKQIARPDAQPWVKLDYARAFGTRAFSDSFFSMVSSAAARDTLQHKPFDSQIAYSEDVAWAKKLRENGGKIIYVPEAVVEHSHNYTLPQVKKRFYGEGYADGEIWGESQSYSSYAKGLAGGIFRDMIWLVKTGALTKIGSCLRYRIAQKTSYRRGLMDYLKGVNS